MGHGRRENMRKRSLVVGLLAGAATAIAAAVMVPTAFADGNSGVTANPALGVAADLVVVSMAACNRDPRAFDDPDVPQVDRQIRRQWDDPHPKLVWQSVLRNE